MSNISRNAISGKSSQDLYIMLLSEGDRAKLESEGKLTPEQLKLPFFTNAEIKEFLNSLSFQRLLLIVGLQSMGKTDQDMAQFTKELQEIQGYIDVIQKGITLAQSAKADKKEKVNFSGEFKDAITKMAILAKEKKLTIDIELKEDATAYWSELKTEPDLVIGQLQNISATWNSEIKNITTKIQKAQADRNTIIETNSGIMKSLDEMGKTTLRQIS